MSSILLDGSVYAPMASGGNNGNICQFGSVWGRRLSDAAVGTSLYGFIYIENIPIDIPGSPAHTTSAITNSEEEYDAAVQLSNEDGEA